MVKMVECGDSKSLLNLIDFGNSSNICDSYRDPLLFIPIVNGNVDMLDTLLTFST